MKTIKLIILSLLLLGCNSSEVSVQEFTPTFNLDYNQNCDQGAPVIGEDKVFFNPGRVRSAQGYKNISKISATVDISKLAGQKFVNATFYLVMNETEYCDSGDGCTNCCDEIDFLETNGNVATQATIHINKTQNYQWAFLGGDTSCFTGTTGTGIVDASKIDPSLPFDVVTEFNDDYTNMTTTYVQGDNSVVVYDFKNNEAGPGSGLTSLDGLKENMEKGYKVVASLWQGFSPNPDNLYNYSDPNCSGWSDLCKGGSEYTISNVRVTAESVVEKLESDPVTVRVTFINDTDQDMTVKATWGVDRKDQTWVIPANGGKADVESNSHANSGSDFIIIPGLNPPTGIKPVPTNGQFRMTYNYWNGQMHCVYWNQSGAPMDGTIYSDDNSWKYTTEWATNPANQSGNPLVNTVTIKTAPCTTTTVGGKRVCN